jgi:hypothetical protein
MAHTSRSIVPLIAIPDAEDLGPAMQACNIGERAWVIAKIETGESNKECARLAGYSAASDEGLKAAGYAIAHRQRVQDALLEMSRKLMRTEGAKSIKTLVAIRDEKANKPEIRLKASVELLDRAGMNAVSESHLTVTHQLSDAQMDQRILALASELGLTEDVARKMLISPADLQKNADAIDADFEEVATVSAEEQSRRDHENDLRRKVRAMSPDELKAHKAQLRRDQSERTKAKRAAAEAERLLATGREGLEDLID